MLDRSIDDFKAELVRSSLPAGQSVSLTVIPPRSYRNPTMSHVFAVVYESSKRSTCMEMRLVLDAVGLTARVSRSAGQWRVMVADDQADLAIAELSAYQQDEHEADVAANAEHVSLDKDIAKAALGFAVVTITCSMAAWYAVNGPEISAAGYVDASLVQDGQWWRVVTALTLHLDWGHLLSNLVFGALFIALAGKWLGGGVAWLLTVFGGASGNLLNAFLHDASHISLGASTAVFAALGIAVANALRPSLKAQTRPMRRWSPLIAGGLLLAMTGTSGDRTDVGAHVAGFAMGLGSGWLSSHLPRQWLSSNWCQWVAAITAVTIIAGAWLIAWTSVG